MHKQKYSDYLFIYIICAAVLFLLGLALCYALPADSYLYSTLENSVTSSLLDSRTFDVHVLASSFLGELKYLFFVFVAGFCMHRNAMFCLVCAFKGVASGICCACLMRAVKLSNINARFEIVGCLFFVLLTVATVYLLCFSCSISTIYSKNIIYPPKIKHLIKRKDTYVYLLNFCAICGVSLVIILLKHGNLFLLISPKGL